MKPSEAYYYTMLAKCYVKTKNLEMAIQEFQSAMERDPANENNRINLSQLLFDTGRYEESIKSEYIIIILFLNLRLTFCTILKYI